MPTRLTIVFYRTHLGREPVRQWLKDLSPADRKRVSTDIRTVEFGWPVGMPVCRPLGNGVWEVRSRISAGRITRVLFFIEDDVMYLLHGFVKKTQTTPKDDLELAIRRMNDIKRGME
jgi:phage-related protein